MNHPTPTIPPRATGAAPPAQAAPMKKAPVMKAPVTGVMPAAAPRAAPVQKAPVMRAPVMPQPLVQPVPVQTVMPVPARTPRHPPTNAEPDAPVATTLGLSPIDLDAWRPQSDDDDEDHEDDAGSTNDDDNANLAQESQRDDDDDAVNNERHNADIEIPATALPVDVQRLRSVARQRTTSFLETLTTALSTASSSDAWRAAVGEVDCKLNQDDEAFREHWVLKPGRELAPVDVEKAGSRRDRVEEEQTPAEENPENLTNNSNDDDDDDDALLQQDGGAEESQEKSALGQKQRAKVNAALAANPGVFGRHDVYVAPIPANHRQHLQEMIGERSVPTERAQLLAAQLAQYSPLPPQYLQTLVSENMVSLARSMHSCDPQDIHGLLSPAKIGLDPNDHTVKVRAPGERVHWHPAVLLYFAEFILAGRMGREMRFSLRDNLLAPEAHAKSGAKHHPMLLWAVMQVLHSWLSLPPQARSTHCPRNSAQNPPLLLALLSLQWLHAWEVDSSIDKTSVQFLSPWLPVSDKCWGIRTDVRAEVYVKGTESLSFSGKADHLVRFDFPVVCEWHPCAVLPGARRAGGQCEKCAQQRERYRSHAVTPRALHHLGHQCMVCGRQSGLMRIDHSHISGNVRGLLCHSCNANRLCAKFEQQPHLLVAAATYLLFRGGPSQHNHLPPNFGSLMESTSQLLDAALAQKVFSLDSNDDGVMMAPPPPILPSRIAPVALPSFARTSTASPRMLPHRGVVNSNDATLLEAIRKEEEQIQLKHEQQQATKLTIGQRISSAQLTALQPAIADIEQQVTIAAQPPPQELRNIVIITSEDTEVERLQWNLKGEAKRYENTGNAARRVKARGDCAVCGEASASGTRVNGLDHSHLSGCARGWLCDGCNRMMGGDAENDPRILLRCAIFAFAMDPCRLMMGTQQQREEQHKHLILTQVALRRLYNLLKQFKVQNTTATRSIFPANYTLEALEVKAAETTTEFLKEQDFDQTGTLRLWQSNTHTCTAISIPQDFRAEFKELFRRAWLADQRARLVRDISSRSAQSILLFHPSSPPPICIPEHPLPRLIVNSINPLRPVRNAGLPEGRVLRPHPQYNVPSPRQGWHEGDVIYVDFMSHPNVYFDPLTGDYIYYGDCEHVNSNPTWMNEHVFNTHVAQQIILLAAMGVLAAVVMGVPLPAGVPPVPYPYTHNTAAAAAFAVANPGVIDDLLVAPSLLTPDMWPLPADMVDDVTPVNNPGMKQWWPHPTTHVFPNGFGIKPQWGSQCCIKWRPAAPGVAESLRVWFFKPTMVNAGGGYPRRGMGPGGSYRAESWRGSLGPAPPFPLVPGPLHANPCSLQLNKRWAVPVVVPPLPLAVGLPLAGYLPRHTAWMRAANPAHNNQMPARFIRGGGDAVQRPRDPRMYCSIPPAPGPVHFHLTSMAGGPMLTPFAVYNGGLDWIAMTTFEMFG